MRVLSVSLALLSGAIGAGFASGREIVRFFAAHGRAAPAAMVCALCALAFFFLRLCAQLTWTGCASLPDLCRLRFGGRLGSLCAVLFFALCAVTGGAMLCATAEIGALLLPLRHAYGITLCAALLLGVLLARKGMAGLALPGVLLCALLPALLVPMLFTDAAEACFLPAMAPDLPVRAMMDGTAYGALNAAMLCPMLPALLKLDAKQRSWSIGLFSLLFGALLSLAVAVCRRHMPEIFMQPMPFVHLARSLGRSGYLLLCACLFAAAFSTLCAMLLGMRRLLPALIPSRAAWPLCAGFCLLFAGIGFGPLIESGYPVLGALCAGLLFLLCLPGCPTPSAASGDSFPFIGGGMTKS